MIKKIFVWMAVMILVLSVGASVAEELIVFPAQGQTQEQMDRDKYDCYTWSKQQTGFDPMQPQATPAPPPQRQGPTGERIKGAARGATVGAVVGEIADDDAGKGAAAGAAAGTMAGGMRTRQMRRDQAQQQQQVSQQQAVATNEARNTYNRAFGACMEGKGYTVK